MGNIASSLRVRNSSSIARCLSWGRVAFVVFAFFAGALACSPSEPSEPIGTIASPLPGAWQTVAIGADVGDASFDDGAFTLTSNGQGIAYTEIDTTTGADGMQFAYQAVAEVEDVENDIEIVARVVNITGPDTKVHVGLMIREATKIGEATNLTNVTAEMGAILFDRGTPAGCSPAGGPISQMAAPRRTLVNGVPSARVCAGAAPPTRLTTPFWLRLQRIGDDFYVTRSRDVDGEPARWVPIAVDMSGGEFAHDSAAIGMFVAGNGSLASATFDNVYVGPPRREYRTSTIGSTFVAESTDYLNYQTQAFSVTPDGTSYKYASDTELGHNIDTIGSDGQLIKIDDGLRYATGVAQGGIASDGANLYVVETTNDIDKPETPQPVDESQIDEYLDHCDDWSFLVRRSLPDFEEVVRAAVPGFGPVSGLAVRDNLLFVSDRRNDTIHTLNGDDLTPHAPPFSFGAHPGPLTVDHAGNLWIIRDTGAGPTCGDSWNFKAGSETTTVECRKPNGDHCGPNGSAVVIDVEKATGVAIDPNPVDAMSITNAAGDRLLIADNGPDQNIKVCSNLDATPTCETFGVQGGAFAGPTRGLTSGADDRLFSPNGVGVDAAGNLYVASGRSTVDVRKFAPDGDSWSSNAEWSIAGIRSVGSFDPEGDGADFYTMTGHYHSDDLSTDSWQLQAVTWDPYSGAGDDRPKDLVPEMRRIDHELFMFVHRVNEQRMLVYRFDGELAFPQASLRLGTGGTCVGSDDCCQNNACVEIWHDKPINGILNGKEDVSDGFKKVIIAGAALRWSVDSDGRVWCTTQASGFYEFEPVFNEGALSFAKYAEYPPIAQMNAVSHARSVVDGDARSLYVIGWGTGFEPAPSVPQCPGDPSARWLIMRIDDIDAHAGESAAMTPDAARRVPDPRDSAEMADDLMYRYFDPLCGCSQGGGGPRETLDIAGDLLFVSDASGITYVYNRLGSMPEVTELYPGPEVSGHHSNHDWPNHLLPAFQRSNGEYLSSSMTTSTVRAHTLVYRLKLLELGEPCSTNSQCESGLCTNGVCCQCENVVTECSQLTCDSETGTCGGVVFPDGTECDDSDPNTVEDQCFNEECAGVTTAENMSPAPVAWFVASSDTMTLSNGKVSVWRDPRDNGIEVTNLNEYGQPTYNATGWNGTKPTVTFNGGNLLRRTTWSDVPEGEDQAFTVLAVLRSSANQNGSPIAWWSNTGVSAARCSVVTSGGNSFFNLARDDQNGYGQSYTTTTPIGTDRHVVAWRFSPEVMKITVDGVTSTSSTQSSLVTVSLTHLLIGARSDLPTWLFQGDISELAVFPASISDQAVANFEEYARRVWGGLPDLPPEQP